MMNEPDRVLYLQTDIDDDQPMEIIKAIHDINHYDANRRMIEYITIHLTTWGGFMTTGLALCDAIRLSETPIHMIASGRCMSMGIPILASAHRRSATKNTTFMIHQASSNMGGPVEHLRDELKYVEKLSEMTDRILTDSTKITDKQLQSIYKKKEDFNFYCDKALKWNLIEEVL